MKLSREVLIAGLFSLGIIVASVVPVGISGEPSFGWDKAVHFFMYAVLSVLVARALPARRYFFLLGIAYGVCLGAVLEMIQGVIPYRSFEVNDMVANSMGCFMGFGIFVYFLKGTGSNRRRNEKEKRTL